MTRSAPGSKVWNREPNAGPASVSRVRYEPAEETIPEEGIAA
jgi:hypothetical protein